MTEDILAVSATLKARPGRENRLKALLEGLVRNCAGHDGLLVYTLHQDREDPASFVFYEQFTSREALDAHLETEELCRFREASGELLDGEPGIRFLRILAGLNP